MRDVPEIAPEDLESPEYTLIDVRAPSEWQDGHVPGAVSLPLLDDGERSVVGTVYHDEGASPARVAAMRLTSGKLGRYLGYLRTLSLGGGTVAVMCWRGGDRSGNVVRLLGLVGVEAVRVRGGYRAYRRLVLDHLRDWRPEMPVATLYGYTGSGKTAIIREMQELSGRFDGPRPTVVDLEGLALHRGSLLGGFNQPGYRSQKQFDALLWEALRRAEGDYLVLEGEGAKIGHIFLPATVADAIRGGVPIEIASSAKERAQRILNEYDPGGWSDEEKWQFLERLDRIGTRVPPEVVEDVTDSFSSGRYEEAITQLLVSYYDPLYYRSCVEGKSFAYTLESRGDDGGDALRLLQDLPSVLDLK